MEIFNIESSLSEAARVWFYFIPSALSDLQAVHFQNSKSRFLSSWNTHGQPNEAEIFLIFDRLIVILAENGSGNISGCSIDKSVAWIKELEVEWRMDLLDRNWVLYQDQQQRPKFCKLNLFWAMRKAMEVNDDTLIYDTTVQNWGEMKRHFVRPFSESWHAKMW